MMQRRATTRWPLTGAGFALVAALFSGGCAGAWLERPLAAELPVETVGTNNYPTAIRRVSAGEDAAPMPFTSAEVTAATANNSAATTTAPPSARLDRHQPSLPPLAVIPPQLVQRVAAPPIPAASEAAAPPPTHSESPTIAPSPASSLLAGTTATVSDLPFYWNDSRSWPAPAPASEPTGAAPETGTQLAVQVVPASASQDFPAADPLTRTDEARRELISALEADIRQRREANASDEELPRLEQQLRLVYLTAGRLDDAVAAVESLDEQQQEAYKNLMFGLGVWISPDEARRPPLRSAKVLHSLRDATSDLSAGSKLELRNLVFCERVDYFGWYTEFPRKEFQPKQQVILYVEVENFAAEHKGPAGYETELQGSYEILDASGQIIASRQMQLDKEICRNYRRDYFLAYRIYMPDNIGPGRYRLELTVEDLKARGKYQGRKLGEGMIEFSIR